MNTEKSIKDIFLALYRFVLYLVIISLSVLIVAQLFVGYKIWSQNKSSQNSVLANGTGLNLQLLDLIPVATDAVIGNKVVLKGQETARTNFLLLGEDPEAGLTDTIMIVSYFHNLGTIASINIPRDFYIANADIAGEKINGVANVIDVANKNNTFDKTGIGYLTELIEKEFAINIDYNLKVNIDGLQQAIDLVGGIEINVACTFTDYQYPEKNYNGYLTPAPTFKKGIEKMNGDRAVIYSRSRKSLDCNEGTDFARSRRQSEVIQALMLKIKKDGIFQNSTKINDYLKVINTNLATNLSLPEITTLGLLLKDVDISKNYNHYNLSTENTYLCSTTSNIGSYVIVYGDENNCGLYIPGANSSNIYKTGLRNIIKNLSSEAKIQKEIANQP